MKRFVRWLLPDAISGAIICVTGNLLGFDMLQWQMLALVFVTILTSGFVNALCSGNARS